MVSVVMPAWNAGKYIEQAMESVACQTWQGPVQLIVVDNGSEDETVAIAERVQREWQEKYGRLRELCIEHNPVKGVSATRNMGMNRAEGEYIAFLDADDWWDKDKLKKQMEVMEADPDCKLCSTARELMTADGKTMNRIIKVKEYITLEDLEKQNLINCSSVLMDKKLAIETPMEHDDSHEDYIMWLRVLAKCSYARAVNEPLLKCRQSSDGKSRNKIKSAGMTWKVYRYVGYSFFKSLRCFVCYMLAGVRKYYG